MEELCREEITKYRFFCSGTLENLKRGKINEKKDILLSVA